jgi:hypothetical protein
MLARSNNLHLLDTKKQQATRSSRDGCKKCHHAKSRKGYTGRYDKNVNDKREPGKLASFHTALAQKTSVHYVRKKDCLAQSL